MSSIPIPQILKNHELRLKSIEKSFVDFSNNITKQVDENKNFEKKEPKTTNEQTKNIDINKYEKIIEEQQKRIKSLTDELFKNNKLTYLIKHDLEKQKNSNIEINRLYNLFHTEFLEFKHMIQENENKRDNITPTEKKNTENQIQLDVIEKTDKTTETKEGDKTIEDLKTAIEKTFQTKE